MLVGTGDVKTWLNLPEADKKMNTKPNDLINAVETFAKNWCHRPLEGMLYATQSEYCYLDGTGYPNCLSDDQLSPQARIMALADIFEALTARDRPYKKGKTLSEAMRIMGFMAKDRHIDPELFRIFVKEKLYLKYAKEYMAPSQIDDVDPNIGQ